jgi:hypothetical protein
MLGKCSTIELCPQLSAARFFESDLEVICKLNSQDIFLIFLFAKGF